MGHLLDAEGINVSDAQRHWYVLNPSQARMRRRSNIAGEASNIFRVFFSRILNDSDREMLHSCFVETSDSTRTDFEIGRLLEQVSNDIRALNLSGASELSEEIERAVQSLRTDVVQIIGGDPSGKSRFISRFSKLSLQVQ